MIGQKLYHPKKGWVTIKRKKYKAFGNKIIEIAVDSKGREYELDGTETKTKPKRYENVPGERNVVEIGVAISLVISFSWYQIKSAS